MAALADEEEQWEHLHKSNWRGLGISDPIKSVEVSLL
jgi:DNA-directed RNA polymerase III subunit RPC2